MDDLRTHAELPPPDRPAGLSLSVVIPAFNEAGNIGGVLAESLEALPRLIRDFEIIVVDDGSRDRTAEIVEAIAAAEGRVRLIRHLKNKGYGGALATGFAAATKEWTLFMDGDGQFAIRSLEKMLPFLGERDGVFGYRVGRRDSLLRRLNAIGWMLAVRMLLGVRLRDLNCAFKIVRTRFLHANPLQSTGATINAELVAKFRRAGLSYREIGVEHFNRKAGTPTGGNWRVVIKAFRDLWRDSGEWKGKE